MSEMPTEAQLRTAWAKLREWKGPWDPVNTGNMSVLIAGITMSVNIKRWMEPDGTTMAAAISNGVELERRVVGETLPN